MSCYNGCIAARGKQTRIFPLRRTRTKSERAGRKEEVICCSSTCKKRKRCGRWAPISGDLYPNGGTIEPLDEFGFGGLGADTFCGAKGHYGEFVKAKHPCPDNVDYSFDPETRKITKIVV